VFVVGLAAYASAFGTFIDVFLLGAGILYVKSAVYRPGDDPIRHALSYGPWFFCLVGLVQATGVVFGLAFLPSAGLPATLGTVVIGCAAPFVSFLVFSWWRRRGGRRPLRNVRRPGRRGGSRGISGTAAEGPHR